MVARDPNMQFAQLEKQDGARFSWNVFPQSRLEAARMAVPVSCLYTPLNPLSMPPVNYPPIGCKTPQCGAILNPYCSVDFVNKIWACPFCLTRNHFPPSYAGISPENRPPAIHPACTTMEYMPPEASAAKAPTFLFVVDTCLIDEELAVLKQSIQKALTMLPEDALVGLITFGRNVHVHDLSFDECPKSYVIRGSKPCDAKKVAQLLQLRPAVQPAEAPAHMQAAAGAGGQPRAGNRFLVSLDECEFQLGTILDELSRDYFPHKVTERAARCTGTALSVAIGLLEGSGFTRNHPSRVMLFMGGPPTIGPGSVVGIPREQSIRTHADIQKGQNVDLYRKGIQYYTGLADRAVAGGFVCDIFVGELDQVGLAELKVVAENTGGVIVLDDSFAHGIFQGSFANHASGVFRRQQPVASAQAGSAAAPEAGAADAEEGPLAMCFNAEMQVLVSRELKVSGAIGPLTSKAVKHSCVADQEVGVGGTHAWRLGGLDPATTVGLYFEIVTQEPGKDQAAQQAQQQQQLQGYIQIITPYLDSQGRRHIRVSTIAKTFTDPKTVQGLSYVRMGFDQEAAAVLMARLAVWKSRKEYILDILRWLDRMLIRLMSKFAQYDKDDPKTFQLPNEFMFYPQFMFHLRRSQFLQVFNNSPDETAFFRSVLLRENTTNSLVMIQPTLLSYGLDGPAKPAMLDVASALPDRVLVLDDFFHVVIWYGKAIEKWRKEGLAENSQFEYFKRFLAAPKNDVAQVIERRFPAPQFIECVQKGSQSRFIMAKLDPSITQNNFAGAGMGGGDEPPVFTEDVSLTVFMQHLRRLAVQG